LFACIVDNDNSNTNKSFDENDDGNNNNQCDESPSSKERKTEMNPSSKKSAFYSLLFLSFSLSCSFFSSLEVCRSSTIKSSPLLLLFFPPYNDILLHIRARSYYNSAIRPTNQLFSPLAHFQAL
jgi:hypothetical protein